MRKLGNWKNKVRHELLTRNSKPLTNNRTFKFNDKIVLVNVEFTKLKTVKFSAEYVSCNTKNVKLDNNEIYEFIFKYYREIRLMFGV